MYTTYKCGKLGSNICLTNLIKRKTAVPPSFIIYSVFPLLNKVLCIEIKVLDKLLHVHVVFCFVQLLRLALNNCYP